MQYYGGNCGSYVPSGTQSGCDLVQEWYSYDVAGARLSKTLKVTRGSVNGSLKTTWTYDTEGRVLTVTYPSWKGCQSCSTVNGSSYSFAYDTMGRMNTMTDTRNSRTLVSGMTYGVANEVQQMTSGYATGVDTETRHYNGMFQLTHLQVGAALDISYAYSATQNNGKITSETDNLSVEQVLYTYDALNRLASAQTAGSGGWGLSYNYDGFGNLTDQNFIKGSVPTMHVAYNAATNRQTGDSADYNGNIGSGYIYDLENRLVQPSGSTARYAYDAGNKRVWRGDSGAGIDEIAFWAGQKLATYQVSSDPYFVYFAVSSTNVYFGGKFISKGTYNASGTGDKVNLAPVVADRLGSIGKFYPYGVERPSATGNDKEKYTGYFRDSSTGLDYADQRYEQPGMGRFMTPDSAPSAKLADPGSWNKYAYVGGDPVNRTDPTGQWDFDFWGYSYCSYTSDSESYYLEAEYDEEAFWSAYLYMDSLQNTFEQAILGTSPNTPGGATLSVGLWNIWLANAFYLNSLSSQWGDYHYPSSISLSASSCSHGGGGVLTSNAVLTLTYQVLDQYGAPWNPAWGDVTVNEIVQDTGGSPISGGGIWTTRSNGTSYENTIDSNGYFQDLLTVGGLSPQPPGTALQAFYAVGAFTDMPLTIQMNGNSYGILGNYYASDTVLVNGVNPAGGCK